jgi:ubiquinone/menaquinone biosynthesis C-methylase UbiE
MKRIREKESMDAADEVEVLDKLEKSFFNRWLIRNFVDWALNIGIEAGKVLDIGTGTGLIPIHMFLKNSHLEICGIDISEGMIKKAYENLRAYGLESKITFLVGDAKRLPFKDNYFDLITCNHLLHHLESPVPLLNEIERVAKNDAGILIRDVRRQKTKLQYNLYSIFLKMKYSKKEKELTCNSMAAGFTPEELLFFLNQSNLKGARVVRYYLVPAVLEIIAGIERIAKNRKKSKNIFPDNIPLPFPGKKYLN